MKGKLLILISLFLVIFAVSVLADARITYIFQDQNGNPVDNVDVVSGVCLDAFCSSVSDEIRVNSGDNVIIATYPTVLSSLYGYGNYYFADGYIPLKSNPTWNGNGEATVVYTFTKKAQCVALIDNIQTLNDLRPNVPLVIDSFAHIDADTDSAFNDRGLAPFYMPTGFDDHFSAETLVSLEIKDDVGDVVFSDFRNLNIFMSSTVPVNFEWTPTNKGDYDIVIRSEVVDSQCSSYIPQFTSKQISVLPEDPSGTYYTILNNFEIIGVNGYSFNKISNFADNNKNLFPVGTNVTLNLYDNNGNLISSTVSTLAANPDEVNYVSFSGTFSVPLNGFYTLELVGEALESFGDFDNIIDIISISFSVNPNSVNNAPVLFPIGNKVISVGRDLEFSINAVDPEGDVLSYSVSNLPNGASFSEIINQFFWRPVSVGSFNVTFIVSDGVFSDSETITIQVLDRVIVPEHKFSISSIIVDNWEVSAGEYLEVYVRLTNRGHQDEDDVKVRAFLPELGVFSLSQTMDLGSVENDWLIFELDIPNDVERGEYVIKVTAKNDEFEDIAVTSVVII